MPKAKKNSGMEEDKKKIKEKAKKTSSKSSSSKKPIHKKSSKESAKLKARPVIIDVIEDHEEEADFPDLPPYLTDATSVPEENVDQDFDIEPVDQQKKFFSEMVSEMKEVSSQKSSTEEVKSKKKSATKSVGLYRKLVWQFVLGISILLLVVLYFALAKLTITISPNGEVINDNLLVKVTTGTTTEESTATDFRESVIGNVEEISLNEEKVFAASGEEFSGEEISGKVTLINTTAKDQPLVATTRLLSPDNKLYRLKEAVNIPAGGEIEAEIYVEKPSEDLAISPTNFTIPGLWAGLQDKIYGRSKEPFVYRQKISKYVKASDIEKAISEMNTILLTKAKTDEKNSPENTQTLYEFLTPTKFDYTVKPGEAVESFTLQASTTLLSISFSKDDMHELTSAKLKLLVPDDKKLIEHNPDNINYKLENYDTEKQVATLRLTFNGTMILQSDNELIDKKQLVNLTGEQIETYLKNFSEIKEYHLEFSPSFIKRAPRLPERIEVDIKGLE